MLMQGMFIADRYEVLDKVGAGGMSDVYKAKDHILDRVVAIKVLKQEFAEDATFVAKFRTEAQSAAGLEHPNIVNIYDVGSDNGMYFIVMEYVEGITLKTYIEKKVQLNFKEAVSIAIQVGRGIEAAHQKGIIHRDIKPQNIMISTEGKVKVTDFGIARAASSNTIHADVMGSVHYSSPEQARNGFVDGKSDIYSLGIVMYEMVTGRVPFDGDSTVAVAIQHLQQEMVAPSAYARDLPISLEKIILKATMKSADRRYATISDLLVDLKKALVSPHEDFVTIVDSGLEKTRIISAEEQQTISEKAAAAIINDAEDYAFSGGVNSGSSRNSGVRNSGSVNNDSENSSKNSRKSSRHNGKRFDFNLSNNDDYDEDYDEDYEEDYERDEEFYDDEDDEDSSSKMDKAMTITGIVVGTLIVGILIFFIGSFLDLFHFGDSKEPVEMINVVGMEEQEALDKLYELGLKPKNLTLAYLEVDGPSSYHVGQVFKQSVEEGSEFDLSGKIQLNIAKDDDGNATYVEEGELEIKMDEDDLEIKEASDSGSSLKDKLTNKNKDTNKKTTPTPTEKPKATTTPKATATPTATPTPTAAPKKVKIPDMKGYTEDSAKKTLEDLGLKMSRTYQNDSKVPAGQVISQSPAAGNEATPGDTVALVISQGASKINVPGVIGKTKDEAIAAMKNAGLNVTSTSEDYSDSVAAGKVISQSEPEGKVVDPGANVTLVISRGQAPKSIQYEFKYTNNEHDIDYNFDVSGRHESGTLKKGSPLTVRAYDVTSITIKYTYKELTCKKEEKKEGDDAHTHESSCYTNGEGSVDIQGTKIEG